MADTAKPAKGVRGPLTPIRPPRPDPAQPAPALGTALSSWLATSPVSREGRCTGWRIISTSTAGPTGRAVPPAGFWAAAADHAFSADQAALGDAARARGLYRDAAQLHKNAAASGNIRAAFYLSDPPACLHADPRPAHWAAAHAPLDDPDDVTRLLRSLRAAGAQEQAAALASRAAAHAALDDPRAVARLLDNLRAAGAQEQAAALASRAAAHAPLDDPGAVASLLDNLREAGAREQAIALLRRDPAAHAALDDPRAVASLLDDLDAAGGGNRSGRWPAAPPPTSPSTTRTAWPGCWTGCRTGTA